ncbi:MAG: CxxC-x17-CxxC domain-containing protein [Candidatus Micrarchaeota archaeon]
MSFRDNRSGGDRGGHRSFHGGSGGGGGRGRSGGGGGGFRSSGPREMHDATCSDCGAACKVPFTPTPGRPVYCNDCFSKHRDESPSRGDYPPRGQRERREPAGDNQQTEEPKEETEESEETSDDDTQKE